MSEYNLDDNIFDFCFDLALHDATLQAAYYDKLDSLNPVYDFLKDCTKNYINAIIDTSISIDTIKTSDVIRDINSSEKIINFNSNRDEIKQFKYGNIQKLVNMTAKYMYITSYKNIDLKDRFSKCDCPIDSIISKKIYDKCKDENLDFRSKEYFPELYKNSKKSIRSFFYYLSFSKISESDYLYCQEMLRDFYNATGIGPLEFDYIYWKEDTSSK